MRQSRALALLGALAALAACGGGEGRGDVTAEEDRQLNEAAEMLNEPVFDTSPDSLVANAEALDAEAAAQAGDADGNVQ